MSKMAVIFDAYHHNAEILFVGEESECLTKLEKWWNDMMGAETSWEELTLEKDSRGNSVQSTFDPMFVICEPYVPYECFGEKGIYMAILYSR